jgi:predicted esterase
MLTTDQSVTAEIKLYYDTFVPKTLESPAPLLIAVHGYGAHKIYMMREARLIAPENFVLASIQGPHQFFAKSRNGVYRPTFGWLTDHKSEESVALHHKFILDVIENLVADGTVDGERIFLLGFSQACALNFRFAFTHPQVLKGLIGISGGIPSDLETNPIYAPTEAETLFLYGDNDEFYTNEKFRTFDEKLKEYLPNYHSIKYFAEHVITEEMREDMRQWLKTR